MLAPSSSATAAPESCARPPARAADVFYRESATLPPTATCNAPRPTENVAEGPYTTIYGTMQIYSCEDEGSSRTLTAESASVIGNRHWFQGREWDAEAGLYQFRHRAMDPETGRFVQRDPLGVQGDRLENLYRLNGNAPVRWSDPCGLSPLSATELANVSEAIKFIEETGHCDEAKALRAAEITSDPTLPEEEDMRTNKLTKSVRINTSQEVASQYDILSTDCSWLYRYIKLAATLLHEAAHLGWAFEVGAYEQEIAFVKQLRDDYRSGKWKPKCPNPSSVESALDIALRDAEDGLRRETEWWDRWVNRPCSAMALGASLIF